MASGFGKKKPVDPLTEKFLTAVITNENVQGFFLRHREQIEEVIRNLEEEPEAHDLSNAEVAEQLRFWIKDLDSIVTLLRDDIEDLKKVYDATRDESIGV